MPLLHPGGAPIVIKQPSLIRARVLSEAIRVCKILHTTIGNYYPDEQDALAVLEVRGDNDLANSIAAVIMERFGHARPQPKEPRFDKTRRALRKKLGKGPRGGLGVEA